MLGGLPTSPCRVRVEFPILAQIRTAMLNQNEALHYEGLSGFHVEIGNERGWRTLQSLAFLGSLETQSTAEYGPRERCSLDHKSPAV